MQPRAKLTGIPPVVPQALKTVLRQRINAIKPINRVSFPIVSFLADHLCQWPAASDFEITLNCVRSRNTFVLFKKVNFVAFGATRVALKKPRALQLKHGKAGTAILMEWTPRAFLCVLAQP